MLSINIKEKSALYAAFVPHPKNGGIFIPTTRAYKLGDQVYKLLSLLDDPAKMPVAGPGVWSTPKDAQGNRNRQQGVGVEFVPTNPACRPSEKLRIFWETHSGLPAPLTRSRPAPFAARERHVCRFALPY